MPIIIHASREFVKRFRCQLSLPGEKVSQSGRLDSWSAHYIRVGRKPVVIMMNDASLWSIIIPATGITTLQKLLPVFLKRVSEVWEFHGMAFDGLNQQVVFFSRSNRSLIGSMNDAIHQMRFMEEDARGQNMTPDWSNMEDELNGMPYSALKGTHPKKRLAKLLGGDGD